MNVRLYIAGALLTLLPQVAIAELPSAKSFLGEDKKKTAEPVNVVQKQLEIIQKEQKEASEKKKQVKKLLEKVSKEVQEAEKSRKGALGDSVEFFDTKLQILGGVRQCLIEHQRIMRDMLATLSEHEKLLQNQAEQKEKEINHRTRSTYEDLKETAQRLYERNEQIKSLDRTKTNVQNDISRRKKILQDLQQEYERKKREQEAFASGADRSIDEYKKFSPVRQGDLIDLKLRELQACKERTEAKVLEEEYQLSLVETKLKREREQVKSLKESLRHIKRTLYIDPEHIKKVEKEVDQRRRESLEKREELNEKLRKLIEVEERLEDSLQSKREELGLEEQKFTNLVEWITDPDSVNEWREQVNIGMLSAQKSYVETEKRWLEGQVEREKIKVRHEELRFALLRTWYRLSQQRFTIFRDEDIDREIKEYESYKAQLQADKAALDDWRDQTINRLYRLNVVFDKVNSHIDAFKEQRDTLFRGEQEAYKNILTQLSKAESSIRKRLDLIAKLVEVYSTALATVEDDLRQTEDILGELTTKEFWRRSGQSISWDDLRDFVRNIRQFIDTVSERTVSYVKNINMAAISGAIMSYMQAPYTLLLLLLYALTIIIFYLLCYFYLPPMAQFFKGIESGYGSIEIISAFCALLIEFFYKHLTTLYIWFVLFLSIAFSLIPHTYFAICFYLLSIPYLLYIIHKFFTFFIETNHRRGYLFLSEYYEQPIMWVVPPFCYATSTLMFFRQAFLLANYYDAQILLALNFILLQIALIVLIGLIGKERILRLIEGRTPFWDWIEERAERYYYFVLVVFGALIVMSNPYVGYGRQVLYYFTRIVITLLIVPIFSWVYEFLKRKSSDLFFYYGEAGTVRERFSGGKAWYSLYIIASFFFLVSAGIFIGAFVWGQFITFIDIRAVLNYTLYTPGVNEATGKEIHVTVLSLFKIVFYLVGGAMLTYVVNRLVLRRIFDPLLVGAGIQNTIFTLSRYAIIIVALLIGLQSAGLDALTNKIAVLIALLSFAIKDPISDFFSYFIILVQRPIKIGDLISMDQGAVIGIVRQITPRSTIIRHKNSTTFVVPNSQIITKSVKNWHYTRTFTAIDDILISVGFSTDPVRVRELIFEVLEENTNILKNPKPIVRLSDFLQDGFQFRIRGFISSDKAYFFLDIASDIRYGLVERLRAEGIDLATPVRVIEVGEKSRGVIGGAAAYDHRERAQ